MKISNSHFSRFIGNWKTSGTINTAEGIVDLSGTDSYELILDGHFILHKANVMMGTEKSETIELISMDGSDDRAIMHFYSSKGEAGMLKSSLTKNIYQIKGQGLQFMGTISDKHNLITGNWSVEDENKNWKPFIEMRLEK